MRKVLYILPLLALVLCLALVLMMTGVWSFPEPTEPIISTTGSTAASHSSSQTGSTGSTTAPVDEVFTPMEMISVSLPVKANTIVSEDGVTLFRHTYQDVVLSGPNAQINEAVTLDLLKRMDVNSDIASQVADLVQYYTPGTQWNLLYYEILYTPTRIDSSVLSLHGQEAVSSGNGDATHSQTCVNYHMPTGAVLTLEQILSEESSAQERLLNALLAVLDARAQQLGLFSDYKDTVTQYFQSYLQQESIWYFTDSGLNICFAPYEIAPSSYGTITAEIPYSALGGVLRSDMLPSPRQSVSLQIDIADFAGASLDRYSHFAECLLDANAAPVLITTEKILYDVRLELRSQINGESSATVFAANCLCNDDALMLQYAPKDGQQLILHCTAAGQQHSFSLVQDESGGFRLSPTE